MKQNFGKYYSLVLFSWEPVPSSLKPVSLLLKGICLDCTFPNFTLILHKVSSDCNLFISVHANKKHTFSNNLMKLNEI